MDALLRPAGSRTRVARRAVELMDEVESGGGERVVEAGANNVLGQSRA